MKKFLYFDTETSGLDPIKNSILQLAAIIEIDGEIKEKFSFFMKPLPGTEINQQAIKTNNLINYNNFDDPAMVYEKIIKIFDSYIDRYDRNDKFVMIGQNPAFDYGFLNQFFLAFHNKYLYAYIDYHLIDISSIIQALISAGRFSLPNTKLETICSYFKIPLKAHDAAEDTEAVYVIWNKIKLALSKVEV